MTACGPHLLDSADERGTELRAALSRFFLLGATVALTSLTSLAVVDRFDGPEAFAGLLLIPGAVGGYACLRPLARRIDRGAIREAVLVLSTLSAIAALTRACSDCPVGPQRQRVNGR